MGYRQTVCGMCSLELLFEISPFKWQTSPPRESAKMRKSLTQSVSNRKPMANFRSDDWRVFVPTFGELLFRCLADFYSDVWRDIVLIFCEAG